MAKHREFRVTWTIDENATNPLEAIRKAIAALPHEQNEDTIATVFDVEELDENSKVIATHQIDTLEEGSNPFSDEDLKAAEEQQEDEDEQREIALDKTMDKIRDENF